MAKILTVRSLRLFFAVLLLLGALSEMAHAIVLRSPRELLRLPPEIQLWYRGETEGLSKEMKPGAFHSITQNSQDPAYSPEAANVFKLRGYWLPQNELKIYRSQIPAHLRRTFFRRNNGRAEALLLVHPESESFYSGLSLKNREAEVFLAAATASSRSLLVWRAQDPSHPFVAKVSLDATIGNVDRTIKGSETAMSVGIDQILGQIPNLPKNFGYFHEVFGLIPKGMERGGMIIRTFPKLSRRAKIVLPFFALFADPKDGSEPLITRMIRQSGMGPRQFVQEKIIRPFVLQWLDLAIHKGIIMEPHGQNLLVEVDAKMNLTDVFTHRDFGGFNIDLKFVEEHFGINLSKLPVFSGTLADNYYQNDRYDNIRTSLAVFFGDGALYPIEKNWSAWIQKRLDQRSQHPVRCKYGIGLNPE